MQYYPERYFSRCSHELEAARKTLAGIKGDNYQWRIENYVATLLKTQPTTRDLSYPPIEEIMDADPSDLNEERFIKDPRTPLLLHVLSSKSPSDIPKNILASLIMEGATMYVWKVCGRRIYEMSGDLFWALSNTVLRGLPSEGLRLPVTALYLVFPSNKVTMTFSDGKKYPVEGVIIQESTVMGHRTWLLNTVGTIIDDTSSDWMKDKVNLRGPVLSSRIYLQSHLTADECLDKALSGYNGMGSGDDYITDDEAKKTIRSVFNLAMNAMLYATSKESDAEFYNASKEYRDLKDRAMKAVGDKRKGLFKRLQGMDPSPRILLGGKIVIDRKKELEDEDEGHTGREQRVRSLVSGHYHHYWVGPLDGERELIRKWLQPYWRGPEYAPITERRVSLQ